MSQMKMLGTMVLRVAEVYQYILSKLIDENRYTSRNN